MPRFAVKPTPNGDSEIYFVEKGAKAPAKARQGQGDDKAAPPAKPSRRSPTKTRSRRRRSASTPRARRSVMDSRSRQVRFATADLKTGAPKIVAEDPKVDVREVLVDPKTKKVQAIGVNFDRLTWKAIDPKIQGEDLDALAKVAEDFGVLSPERRQEMDRRVHRVGARHLYDHGPRTVTFLFTNNARWRS
ncbi:MAG: hypothetical protein U0441_18905 [Polyangiaceae bacterium]